MAKACRLWVALICMAIGGSALAQQTPDKSTEKSTAQTQLQTQLQKPLQTPLLTLDGSRSWCDYRDGNIPHHECCDKCKAYVTLNPMPGEAKRGEEVTIGVTPWDFGTPDEIENSGLNIDLGNKAFSNLPFSNGKTQIFHTTYDTEGEYHIQVTVGMQHHFKANDWFCTYACMCSAEAVIKVTDKAVDTANKWKKSDEKKSFKANTQK
ncbi:MAG: hypothetical protein WA734_05015 [Candidatus Acidiferrales bacterium]